MSTLRQRVEQRDHDLFVGRDRELVMFERALRGDDPTRVFHVVGIGGIGKSTLLREVARRAEELGRGVVWMDGRDLPPFPDELEPALSRISGDEPSFVVFDSYELVSSLDSHLRDNVIPELPDSTVVVFASRWRPSRGWYDGGWDSLVHVVELDSLSARESLELAANHGIRDRETAEELIARSHGSPLAVVVGAQAGTGGSVADLADRLLGDEVDTDRFRVLAVAAVARVVTPELLESVIPDTDPHDAYKWLADRSFSEPLADGVALHALVATSVRDSLRERDPAGEASLRRRIADAVYRRALTGQMTLSMDLQHLVVDETVRWGFASDIGSRYRIDSVRPGDVTIIGRILHHAGLDEWWKSTSVFFDEYPDYVGLARDRDGRIGGYYVAVSPGDAPPPADTDVLLGPWLRYAREELRTNSAVLWREAVNLTGEVSEVTSLLGAAGVLGSGVVNPRYGFLPISPLIPVALQFSEALGARHVPALDVHALGMHLECHVIDFGPRGLLGFQRDWIYRESGAQPPSDAAEPDPGRLIRLLRDPSGLSHGPEWLGSRPSERLDRLRDLVRDSLIVFGDSRDDQLARSIIEAAYLGDGAPHEAIARQFHLSRSAYFRRLHAATARVGDELTARHRDRA